MCDIWLFRYVCFETKREESWNLIFVSHLCRNVSKPVLKYDIKRYILGTYTSNTVHKECLNISKRYSEDV